MVDRRSAEALDAFLAASAPVECSFVDWDRYHRFVGDCRRADGVSVASWMVEHGQALDWPRYSHGAYSEQQTKAEASKVGMWVGAFLAPYKRRPALPPRHRSCHFNPAHRGPYRMLTFRRKSTQLKRLPQTVSRLSLFFEMRVSSRWNANWRGTCARL